MYTPNDTPPPRPSFNWPMLGVVLLAGVLLFAPFVALLVLGSRRMLTKLQQALADQKRKSERLALENRTLNDLNVSTKPETPESDGKAPDDPTTPPDP